MIGWEQFIAELKGMRINVDEIYILHDGRTISITLIPTDSSFHVLNYLLVYHPEFDRDKGEYVHDKTMVKAGTVNHIIAFLQGLRLIDGLDIALPPTYEIARTVN